MVTQLNISTKHTDMTNNKQQTAVEWFSVRRDVLEIEVRLGKLSPIEYAEELTKAEQQAKQMEKEQAIKLYYEYELYVMMNESDVMTFGQFYKQTFGGGEQ
jgi:hypothetical protein